MVQLSILQNQWVILGITSGIALVFLIAISYMAIWHPRVNRKYWVTQDSAWRGAFGSIPWILLFTYAGIAVMAMLVLLHYSRHPANW